MTAGIVPASLARLRMVESTFSAYHHAQDIWARLTSTDDAVLQKVRQAVESEIMRRINSVRLDLSVCFLLISAISATYTRSLLN